MMEATWSQRNDAESPWFASASRPRKRARDWRSQSLRAKRLPSFTAMSSGSSRLHPRLLYAGKPNIEDPARVLPIVVAERILVQVGLQVLGRDPVVNAANPILDQRPKAVYGACVNVSLDVHLQTVVNAAVPIVSPKPFHGVVNRGVVRVDDRRWQDTFLDMRHESDGRSLGNSDGT